eukprot:CAMPEP_0197662192 /NCGR_PEP_ID=MMETSP1338-20131121/52420_1 /TAXON_ID=43686 ORGANISM="Pelagodinium beii, Strain RCC1491" /NCGR_SAMPLE_ID=MMETSP1338 /ASSEMBLY_ACC=CAM_ASM_000754 /LENGTH=243 /DNA_ID=CAMNT_0043239921 /DNA_START=67 /DNA_END=798 /DNA_ORIENTATION=-
MSNTLATTGGKSLGTTGGKSLGKSASANSLSMLRTQRIEHEPFWRNQKDLTDVEKSDLEGTWESRHWMHFSRNNPILSPGCRDYFDRPRHLPPETLAEVVKVAGQPVKLVSTWALEPEARDLGQSFGRSKSAGMGRSGSGLPQYAKRESGWNDRHHITVSEANHLFHDNDREYFSKFQERRSKRVIPKRVNGVTQHLYPLKHPGNPDGRDDPVPLSESLLRRGTELPVPALPGAIIHKLSQTM